MFILVPPELVEEEKNDDELFSQLTSVCKCSEVVGTNNTKIFFFLVRLESCFSWQTVLTSAL